MVQISDPNSKFQIPHSKFNARISDLNDSNDSGNPGNKKIPGVDRGSVLHSV
jgi:hypothetical protein